MLQFIEGFPLTMQMGLAFPFYQKLHLIPIWFRIKKVAQQKRISRSVIPLSFFSHTPRLMPKHPFNGVSIFFCFFLNIHNYNRKVNKELEQTMFRDIFSSTISSPLQVW